MSFLSLKKRKEFLHTAECGKRLSNSFFVVLFCEGAALRFGLTVTKKLGNAVQRNLIKRRIRAVLRSLPQDITLALGDYVIIARWKTVGLSFQEFQKNLHALLKKAQQPERHKCPL